MVGRQEVRQFNSIRLPQDFFKDLRFLALIALLLQHGEHWIGFSVWDLAILFGYAKPEGGGLSPTNILFMPLWVSLVASEAAKILTLLCQQSWTWRKRTLASLSSVLYPAYLYQKESGWQFG